MEVTFDPNDASGNRLSANVPQVNANFKSPFGFPLDVQSVQSLFNFLDDNGVPFATLSGDYAPATANQQTGTLQTSMNSATLSALPGQENAFAQFFKKITLSSSVTVPVQGTVNSKAKTAAGVVTISNVPVTDSISLAGLNGLNQVQINSVKVTGGDSQGIIQQISLVMNNPSSITMNLKSDVRLLLQFNGVVIGYTTLPNLVISPGANNIQSVAVLNPSGDQALAAAKTVLNGFMSGQTTPLTITGSSQSVKYASLGPAFSAITISVNLPGQTTPLINNIRITSINAASMTANVILALNNPLDTTYTLTSLNSKVDYNGSPFSTVSPSGLSAPFPVPSKGVAVNSPNVVSNLVLSFTALEASFSLLKSPNGVLVDIANSMSVNVGSYPTSLDYNQKGVTLKLDPSVTLNLIPGLPGIPVGGSLPLGLPSLPGLPGLPKLF
jgi:hypothetical protein